MRTKEYTCDKAPTNRAKCWCCDEEITKGTPRVWFFTNIDIRKGKTMLRDLRVKKLFCYECAPEILDEEIRLQSQAYKDLKRIKKRFIRMNQGKKVAQAITNNKILRSLKD